MPKVTVIPATIDPRTHLPETSQKKRRTAGYARVSTDKDEQFTSYEAQIDYYTKYITFHSDWEFVKVYTDEGISATNTKHRDGFNAMINDALSGKIDLIITKSVSRFARNTVDSLRTIRELKKVGCEVFFEKENIWTFDSKGELLITIMSSLAQEEARSISENVTWGKHKSASDGKVSVGYSHFLGYEKGKNKGDPMVKNPEQAAIVERIYREFLSGKTIWMIAKELTADGIPTPGGKTIWRTSTIESILKNEKYKGCAILQKTYTVDFLTKTIKKNEGEVPQYYVEDSHEAIIPPDEWETVQKELAHRKELGRHYSGGSIFSSKLVCADCGGYFGSKVWHSKDKYRTVIWQCNEKFKKGKEKCRTPHLTEDAVKNRFITAFNQLFDIRNEIIGNCKEQTAQLTDTTEVDTEIASIIKKMEVVAELTRKCVEKNAKIPQSQDEYLKQYHEYSQQFDALKKQHEALTEKRSALLARADAFRRFIRDLKKQESALTEFDDRLWQMMVEKVFVEPDGILRFRFYNGMEIES